VTRYSSDHTQGPACAIAAGAATIYRNYFAPVDGESGQTRNCQIDALAGIGAALSAKLGCPVADLWTMRNGYALCTEAGLDAITRQLAEGADEVRDQLRGQLAIGLHLHVQVTDVLDGPRRHVSQAFCSALPVAYSSVRPSGWEAFARLVLEATYEATLLAAVEQANGGGSNIVLLTRVGGGAFGNDDDWIHDAIVRALGILKANGCFPRHDGPTPGRCCPGSGNYSSPEQPPPEHQPKERSRKRARGGSVYSIPSGLPSLGRRR
jgi:hypothetical protein